MPDIDGGEWTVIYELDRTLEALLVKNLKQEEFGSLIKASVTTQTPFKSDENKSYSYRKNIYFLYPKDVVGSFLPFSQGPMVNLYLYKIEECKDFRHEGECHQWSMKTKQGYTQKAPVWVDCYYAIQISLSDLDMEQPPFKGKFIYKVQAEHWIYSNIIRILRRYAHIPERYRQGELAKAENKNLIKEIQLSPLSMNDNAGKLMLGIKVTLGIPYSESMPLSAIESINYKLSPQTESQ